MVMSDKKPYVPPRLTAYDPKNAPEWVKLLREDLLNGSHVAPTPTAVVDRDPKLVHVSANFCELVGYEAEDLIGTRHGHLTALKPLDSHTADRLCMKHS